MAELTISCDGDQAMRAAQSMRVELEAAPEWLRLLATEALQRLDESVELVAFDGDGSTASGAGDLRVCAKPTDKFLALLAAVRAGNRQLGILVDVDLEHGGLHG